MLIAVRDTFNWYLEPHYEPMDSRNVRENGEKHENNNKRKTNEKCKTPNK